ncbi:MAG: M23 family metallopeptidase, partial [Pararhizobium sp.]
MSQNHRNQVFGRRSRQHTIIIASGETIRHFTIRPWTAILCGTAGAALLVGYLAATSYLVFRDDLIDVATARQARIEHAYEDRIAALRTQLDRMTSRSVIDHETIEKRVETLYQRQLALTSRHSKLAPLLRRAESAGLLSGDIPVPLARPSSETADAAAGSDASANATAAMAAVLGTAKAGGEASGKPDVANAYVEPSAPAAWAANESPIARDPDSIVSVVATSLRTVEGDQEQKVQSLTKTAEATASSIETLIHKSGLPLADAKAPRKETAGKDGVGGPFIPITDPAAFDLSLSRLDKALDRLESVRRLARSLPFGQPLRVDVMTSPFGARSDTFLGEAAFQPGIDFREDVGSAVHATCAGTVTKAGWVSG